MHGNSRLQYRQCCVHCIHIDYRAQGHRGFVFAVPRSEICHKRLSKGHNNIRNQTLIIPVVCWRAIAALPKQNSGAVFKFSCKLQIIDISVYRIDGFMRILQEQYASARVDLIRSAQGIHKRGQIPPHHRRRYVAWYSSNQIHTRRVLNKPRRYIRRNRSEKLVKIISGRVGAKVDQHKTVKRNQVCILCQDIQQYGDITVSADNFGMKRDIFIIEIRQYPGNAHTSPSRKYHTNRRVLKHPHQVGRSLLIRRSDIPCIRIRIVTHYYVKPHLAKRYYAGVNDRWLKWASKGHNSYRIPGP